MDTFPSHYIQSAADSSSDIVFKPDIFDCDISISNPPTGSEGKGWSLFMIEEQQRAVGREQIPSAANPKSTSFKARTNKRIGISPFKILKPSGDCRQYIRPFVDGQTPAERVMLLLWMNRSQGMEGPHPPTSSYLIGCRYRSKVTVCLRRSVWWNLHERTAIYYRS